MSETKFTKGPWSQSHRKTRSGGHSTQVYDNNGETICTLAWYAVPTKRGFTTNRSENAQLIACAPDMYKHIEEDIEILQRQAKQYVFGSHELRAINLRIEAKQKLLKRARGE